MKTFFVTANNTNVGKTYFCQQLIHFLIQYNYQIQYVKIIQTGQKNNSDGDIFHVQSQFKNYSNKITYHNYLTFKEPVSPAYLEKIYHKEITIEKILTYIHSLEKTDIRIIESAGGISTPINNNMEDWRDVLDAIKPTLNFVVIENTLGAINQTQLVKNYLNKKNIKNIYILNQRKKNIPSIILLQNEACIKKIPILFGGKINAFHKNIQWENNFNYEITQ